MEMINKNLFPNPHNAPLYHPYESRRGGIFILCLVRVILGRMENIQRKSGWKTVFSTVWQKKENTEDGKLERKFSLLGPQILSSQIGRKIVGRKVDLWHFYANALWNQVKKKKKKKKEREETERERWRIRAVPASVGSLERS